MPDGSPSGTGRYSLAEVVTRLAIQLISTGGLYGAERALLELAGFLRDRGWSSRVVALEGRGAGDLVRLAEASGLSAEAFVLDGRMALLPMLARLRRLLASCPQAIVHSHGYKPDLLLRFLNTPRRLACVATCHSWYSETRKLKLLELADKRALRGFDHVIAVSPEIRAELLGSSVPAVRVTLINNGISTPAFDPAARGQVRAELGLPPGCRLLVQIGRLAPSKRNDLPIAAIQRLREAADVHLLFAGEGEQRGQLTGQVAASGLGRQVHFLGYRNDAARLLCAADVAVVSSDKEGLPITILEAMAVRCPIVSTAVGAIPDALRGGTDAWLVPANDVGALAAAIDEALGKPMLARARAESAYQRFRLGYSREAMGRAYLGIYDRVWEARGWS